MTRPNFQNRFKSSDSDEVWAQQIAFWRDHLDIAIEQMFHPVKQKDQQAIIARAFGRNNTLDIVQSRGAGKTWLIAMCCAAMCVLYPGTIVMCCSGTAKQAALVLGKIDREASSNPNMMNELVMNIQGKVTQITKDGGKCKFKNGSEIVAMAISSMRGQRAKIQIIDESPEVKLGDDKKIFMPVRNYTREVCLTYDLPDYESKVIKISSACLKSNDFYEDFIQISRKMGEGDDRYFSVALDYEFAIRTGISPASFFEEERASLPQSQFNMEYGSIFIGAESNSIFPYELTDKCRTLEHVETRQPKNSSSEYIMSVDIATSSSARADNSVISVIKIAPKEDATYSRQLVYMRSYAGKQLDETALEIRKLMARFPNTTRVVFDANALGESLPRFMNKPWVDPETGKEHPPLVLDSELSFIPNAKPILHGFRGNTSLNQKMATNLRVSLEQQNIQFPVNSRSIMNGNIIITDTLDLDPEIETPGKRVMPMSEQAIYYEVDALQIEMGNVVATVSPSGNYMYGTARDSQKKDRYSSLAMGNNYISEIEEISVRRHLSRNNDMFVGVAIGF